MSSQHRDDILALVQGDDGAEWAEARTGWDLESEVCTWDGIKCDTTNTIHTINLEGTDLYATLPTSIGSIRTLTHLYLGSNILYGTIPHQITSLPNLVQLDLGNNKLRGTVPFRSGMVSTKLEVVNLARNQLSGGLEKDWGKGWGRAISILDLKGNRLAGTVPNSIGEMVNLIELDLSNNRFSGPIPDTLGSLTKLEGLFLSNNQFIGKIPHSLTRDNLSLSHIFLHGNALSGTIPLALADLPKLKILFLDDNKLTGTVPQELCDLNLNEAFFSNFNPESSTSTIVIDKDTDDSVEEVVKEDDVYGEDDDAYNFDDDDPYWKLYQFEQKLQAKNGVNMGGNGGGSRRRKTHLVDSFQTNPHIDRSLETSQRDGCNSIACPSSSRSSRLNGKDGVYPCVPCPANYHNPYLGSNKCYELNEGKILRHLFMATDGQNWAEGYEDWGEEGDVCMLKGVDCNRNGQVASVVLRGVGLFGIIPESLGFLRHLEVLDLRDNNLVGRIPSSLRFAPIQHIDLSNNKLSGFIPPSLCQKSNINGNGKDGDLSCDVIACPVGTFSKIGRAQAGDDGQYKCLPCADGAKYIGSKVCNSLMRNVIPSGPSDGPSGAVIGVLILLVLVTVGTLIFIIKRRTTKEGDNHQRDVRAMYGGEDFETSELRPEPRVHSVTSSYLSNNMPPPPDPLLAGTFPESVEVKVKTKSSEPAQHNRPNLVTQEQDWSASSRSLVGDGSVQEDTTKEVWLDVPKIN